MLRAIVDHFSQFGEVVQLASDPFDTFDSYPQRAEYRLLQITPRVRLGRSSLGFSVLPKRMRYRYGLVHQREVGAVLDASGFIHGDQWGSRFSERMARRVKRWKTQGRKIVLLPQAFGPFKIGSNRRPFQEVLENVDLVFARDRISFEHIDKLNGGRAEIKCGPDFTNLVTVPKPQDFDHDGLLACIVPNIKMIQETAPEESRHYIGFLACCVNELLRREIEPVLACGEETDKQLFALLQERVGKKLRQFRGRNLVDVKGLIAECKVVIASRFHALVSGFSQGIPCLGSGWSHKYGELFEDYSCPELLLSPTDSQDKIRESLHRTLEEPTRSQIIDRIRQAAALQREAARAMWKDVDRLLGLVTLHPQTAPHN